MLLHGVRQRLIREVRAVGFLDGVPGFMAAVMGSVSVYFKYAKLYELQNELGAVPKGADTD